MAAKKAVNIKASSTHLSDIMTSKLNRLTSIEPLIFCLIDNLIGLLMHLFIHLDKTNDRRSGQSHRSQLIIASMNCKWFLSQMTNYRK